MATAVTHGIHVTVKAAYEPAHSDPRAAHYLFSYRVTITNTGRETVRLLRRHWFISDSLGPTREVEGPGVVGETPVLPPGEHFTYSSACDLRSGLGQMRGSYLMERTHDGTRFRVEIPAFLLHFPHSSN
jgi:ApaG protein